MSTATAAPPVAGRHLIAGHWHAPTGAHFESRNPARADEVLGLFPKGTATDATQAVAAARAAYPAWRRSSRIHRAELFDNLAQVIKQETDNLARLMARECGKVITECRAEVVKGFREVSSQFADRIVATETGSKSAVIVCEDARLDLAATCAVISAFKTSGQRCVSASRILVHEKLIDPFVDKFVSAAKRLRIGDPLESANFTGPVIHRDSVEKILRYNALARQEGAEVLLDGGPMTSGEHALGCYLSPFVYRARYRPEARTIREEVFGPHVAVIPFRDNDEAIRIYNDTPFGLSMAVITEGYRTMRYFREECEFGMGYVNLPCIGAEVHLPFGGVKQSGNGHPSAAGLVETVTHKIAWTVNHGTEVKMAQGLTTAIEGGPA